MSTLADLITRLRNEYLNDNVGSDSPLTYRWSNANIVNALNDAEREIAKRTLYIADATTPSICNLTLAATAGVYPQSLSLSNKVLRVRFVRFPYATGGEYRQVA